MNETVFPLPRFPRWGFLLGKENSRQRLMAHARSLSVVLPLHGLDPQTFLWVEGLFRLRRVWVAAKMFESPTPEDVRICMDLRRRNAEYRGI